MTIVLDQSCGFLADRLKGYSVFVRRDEPREVSNVSVDKLRHALRADSVPGPYLLVGASFGGFAALFHAYRHRQEVAGVLLLDASHPRQSAVVLSALPEDLPANPEIKAFRQFVKGFGPVWDQSCRLFDGVGSLGDVLLTALAAEHPPMPRSLPESVRSRLTEGWHGLQRDHALRSDRGQMRVVAGSGHEIAKDAPDVVVKTIEAMIDQIEQRSIQAREGTPEVTPHFQP